MWASHSYITARLQKTGRVHHSARSGVRGGHISGSHTNARMLHMLIPKYFKVYLINTDFAWCADGVFTGNNTGHGNRNLHWEKNASLCCPEEKSITSPHFLQHHRTSADPQTLSPCLQPAQNNGLNPHRCAQLTHHFTVRVFAQPRGELDGAHKHEEQTQGEGQSHDGYCPWRGHAALPCTHPGASRGGECESDGFPVNMHQGDGLLGEPQEKKWRRAGPPLSVPHPRLEHGVTVEVTLLQVVGASVQQRRYVSKLVTSQDSRGLKSWTGPTIRTATDHFKWFTYSQSLL